MTQPVITSDELNIEGELFKHFNIQVFTFLFSTNHVVSLLLIYLLIVSPSFLTCIVGSKPDDIAAFTVDLTSALVTWDPPFPPNQTVGYQVYYTGPTNGSVTADVFGAQTGSTTATGLLNGGVYSFSVAGKSAHFESENVASQYGSIYLCKHLKHTRAKISLYINCAI